MNEVTVPGRIFKNDENVNAVYVSGGFLFCGLNNTIVQWNISNGPNCIL